MLKNMNIELISELTGLDIQEIKKIEQTKKYC